MKLAVFYYTQSGQALSVAKSICKKVDHVVYKQVTPQQSYPFLWSRDEFLDVFPETRLGIPPSGIVPLDFSDVEDADMVMIVGQSWYLSPSLPLQSFFTDNGVRNYLKGRDVVMVNACRNMWLMTSRKVKEYLTEAGARLVGHIVMQDPAQNLVSVLTVVRWLMKGKKEGTRLLPPAGIPDRDIEEASRFGEIIETAWNRGELATLQDGLLAAGAIHYQPSVLFLEKTGHRMFALWARFVRRKGGFGDKRRLCRLHLFYAYLLTVLFLLSPLAQLMFWLTYPLHRAGRKRVEDCSV